VQGLKLSARFFYENIEFSLIEISLLKLSARFSYEKIP
jgi:hypothetical protein